MAAGTCGCRVQRLCRDVIWVRRPTSLPFNTRLLPPRTAYLKQGRSSAASPARNCKWDPAWAKPHKHLNSISGILFLLFFFFCGSNHICHSATILRSRVVWYTLRPIWGSDNLVGISAHLSNYPLKAHRGRGGGGPNHTSKTTIDDVMTTHAEMSDSPFLTRVLRPLKAKPHVEGRQSFITRQHFHLRQCSVLCPRHTDIPRFFTSVLVFFSVFFFFSVIQSWWCITFSLHVLRAGRIVAVRKAQLRRCWWRKARWKRERILLIPPLF